MSHGQTVTEVSVVCEVTLLYMCTPLTVPNQYSWLPNVTPGRQWQQCLWCVKWHCCVRVPPWQCQTSTAGSLMSLWADSDSSVCGVWSDIVVYPPESATPEQPAILMSHQADSGVCLAWYCYLQCRMSHQWNQKTSMKWQRTPHSNSTTGFARSHKVVTGVWHVWREHTCIASTSNKCMQC